MVVVLALLCFSEEKMKHIKNCLVELKKVRNTVPFLEQTRKENTVSLPTELVCTGIANNYTECTYSLSSPFHVVRSSEVLSVLNRLRNDWLGR